MKRSITAVALFIALGLLAPAVSATMTHSSPDDTVYWGDEQDYVPYESSIDWSSYDSSQLGANGTYELLVEPQSDSYNDSENLYLGNTATRDSSSTTTDTLTFDRTISVHDEDIAGSSEFVNDLQLVGHVLDENGTRVDTKRMNFTLTHSNSLIPAEPYVDYPEADVIRYGDSISLVPDAQAEEGIKEIYLTLYQTHDYLEPGIQDSELSTYSYNENESAENWTATLSNIGVYKNGSKKDEMNYKSFEFRIVDNNGNERIYRTKMDYFTLQDWEEIINLETSEDFNDYIETSDGFNVSNGAVEVVSSNSSMSLYDIETSRDWELVVNVSSIGSNTTLEVTAEELTEDSDTSGTSVTHTLTEGENVIDVSDLEREGMEAKDVSITFNTVEGDSAVIESVKYKGLMPQPIFGGGIITGSFLESVPGFEVITGLFSGLASFIAEVIPFYGA